MDRHPQQIKRERQDKKRRLNNVALMSKLKTSIKKITIIVIKNTGSLIPTILVS